jgi:hypothetical protein
MEFDIPFSYMDRTWRVTRILRRNGHHLIIKVYTVMEDTGSKRIEKRFES